MSDWEFLELEAIIQRLTVKIDQLTLENWQLKGALGYPVPGDIPPGNFRCGMCDARHREELDLPFVETNYK